jgi:hypothetical protein
VGRLGAMPLLPGLARLRPYGRWLLLVYQGGCCMRGRLVGKGKGPPPPPPPRRPPPPPPRPPPPPPAPPPQAWTWRVVQAVLSLHKVGTAHLELRERPGFDLLIGDGWA